MTPQADAQDVRAAAEAFRLLRSVGVDVDALSAALRLEPDEVRRFVDDPAAMRPLVRMRLAAVLRDRAPTTPDPARAAAAADELWTRTTAQLQERFSATLDEALRTRPDNVGAEFARLVLEELGPEVFEQLSQMNYLRPRP